MMATKVLTEQQMLKIALDDADILRKRVEKLEEENRKLKSDLEKFSEAYKRYRDYEKEELAESCYDFARENKNLKLALEQMENTCKDYLNDRDTLREGNRKLKEEIDKIKQRVKEHTTYSIKAEFIKKFLD